MLPEVLLRICLKSDSVVFESEVVPICAFKNKRTLEKLCPQSILGRKLATYGSIWNTYHLILYGFITRNLNILTPDPKFGVPNPILALESSAPFGGPKRGPDYFVEGSAPT